MHYYLNPAVMLFYLQGPFILYTLSAEGGRITISLQVYPFKLIIKCRRSACGVCSNSPLMDSNCVHPFPSPLPPNPTRASFWDTGSQEAGLWGLVTEEKRHNAEMQTQPPRQQPWASPMEANLQLKMRLIVQPAVHLKKLSTGWDAGPGWGKWMENREQEGSEQKARGRTWSDFPSLWAFQCHRLISQMLLTTKERRKAEREGGRDCKGPGQPGFWWRENTQLSFFGSFNDNICEVG